MSQYDIEINVEFAADERIEDDASIPTQELSKAKGGGQRRVTVHVMSTYGDHVRVRSPRIPNVTKRLQLLHK